MLEVKGDLFEYPCDAICIPTNGIVKSNGEAVMGAGVAKAALRYYPGLPKALGTRLLKSGNRVFVFGYQHPKSLSANLLQPTPDFERSVGCRIDSKAHITFPTKNDWRDPSSIHLIEHHARSLEQIVTALGWKTVALPRIGCGLGGLAWEDVRHVLEMVWWEDERFVVVNPSGS